MQRVRPNVRRPFTSTKIQGVTSQKAVHIIFIAATRQHCNNPKRSVVRGQLKCDGTRAETRFRPKAKRTSPFKSAGASVQSTTCGRGVRISGSIAGYTMFRGSVKGTGYPIHSPVSPSLPSSASPCSITFQLKSSTCNTCLNRKIS
jgi:hypothetical protein